jgi:hypothetical protein
VADIVATGTWLYDGTVPTEVRIVRLDFDFWHKIAEADEDLAEGEASSLNQHGHLFYVRTRPGDWSDSQPFWPDSPGFETLDAAKAHAAATVPTDIKWR